MNESSLWSESGYKARCFASLVVSSLASFQTKDFHTPPVPRTLTTSTFVSTRLRPDLHTTLHSILHSEPPYRPKPLTISSNMASDTYSVTLPVPELGVRTARALCNHLEPTLSAKSVQYHREEGVLEIVWPAPSNAYSNLEKLGDPSLTDAASRHDRVGRISGDGQSHRSESFDQSQPDGKTISYGKKACALRVHNKGTGGQSCHTLRQGLDEKWSAASGAICFPQEDKSMRVEDGDRTMRFLPGKVRKVIGKDNGWSTVTTTSPDPLSHAGSLSYLVDPSSTSRPHTLPSEFVITLDVPKKFPDAQQALTLLGSAIGAKSIEYHTAANSVKITMDEPIATGNLEDFLKASLASSKHNTDGQCENENQTEPDLELEPPGWFTGHFCSLYIRPTPGMSYDDPFNKGRKTHTFIRDLKGNLSVASGANGRRIEEGGMTVWDGDLALGVIAGRYSRKQGKDKAWTIETMQAPKPNSELHSPDLFKMLQGAKPRTNFTTRDATVVTII